MKILLVGNYPPDAQLSMERYLHLFAATLDSRGYKVAVMRPRRVFAPESYRFSGFLKVFGYIDKLLVFPAILLFRQLCYTHVHICDHSNALYSLVLYRKFSVSVHDMIAVRASLEKEMGWTSSRFGRAYQRMVLRGLSQASALICVSEETKRDLIRLQEGACLAPIFVIANPVSRVFRPYTEDRGGNAGVRLLHVGSDQPRKNRMYSAKLLVELHRRGRSEATLTFVGPPLSSEMNVLLENHGLESHVRTLANLSDEQLAIEYQSASLLIFPSLWEGFGWPIIEANACGRPALVFDKEPMRSVGGSGVICVEEGNVSHGADAVERVLTSEEYFRKLSISNAALYGPQRFSERLDAFFAGLASGSWPDV